MRQKPSFRYACAKPPVPIGLAAYRFYVRIRQLPENRRLRVPGELPEISDPSHSSLDLSPQRNKARSSAARHKAYTRCFNPSLVYLAHTQQNINQAVSKYKHEFLYTTLSTLSLSPYDEQVANILVSALFSALVIVSEYTLLTFIHILLYVQ